MTPLSFQVTLDCSDPHTLADWWAEALGWSAEPSDEAFIQRMIDEGHAMPADTTQHRGVLVWREAAAIRQTLGDGTGDERRAGGRMLFMRVDEPKSAKNRMHLDVFAGDQLEATVARLVAAGAAELWRGAHGTHHWVTMADPEGNEFCVA